MGFSPSEKTRVLNGLIILKELEERISVLEGVTGVAKRNADNAKRESRRKEKERQIAAAERKKETDDNAEAVRNEKLAEAETNRELAEELFAKAEAEDDPQKKETLFRRGKEAATRAGVKWAELMMVEPAEPEAKSEKAEAIIPKSAPKLVVPKSKG